MALLLIAEHHQDRLTPSTLATLTAAQHLSGPIHMVVMGARCGQVAEEAASLKGVEKVWVVEDPLLTPLIAEAITETLLEMAKAYTHILAPSSTFGKNLLP